MSGPLSARILEANAVLYAEGGPHVVSAFFTEGYRVHFTAGEMALGQGGAGKVLEMYRRAFPDIQVEVEILVEAGDRVAWLRTFRATHLGAFRGFPASKRAMVWRDMVTSRFEEGRIAEEWLVTDLAEQLLAARKG